MERMKIDDMIKDYHWMKNVIKNYLLQLEDTDQKTIAQYGIQSVMPKAQGENVDPILKVVERREKKWQKVARYQEKIDFIDRHSARIEDESERFVLDSVLEGKSLAAIGREMGLSWRQVDTIYGRILDEIVADVEKSEKSTKEKVSC